jgi:hypothetical protein
LVFGKDYIDLEKFRFETKSTKIFNKEDPFLHILFSLLVIQHRVLSGPGIDVKLKERKKEGSSYIALTFSHHVLLLTLAFVFFGVDLHVVPHILN